MVTQGSQNTVVDDEGFAAFLEEDTTSVISNSTLGSQWSELQVIEADQGNELILSPALESHFLAMCVDGFGLANISFDALSGPCQTTVQPGTLCFMPARQPASFAMLGRARSMQLLINPAVFTNVLEMADDPRTPDNWNLPGFNGRFHSGIQKTILQIRENVGKRGALWSDMMALKLATQLIDFAAPHRQQEGPIVDLTDLQFANAIDYLETHLTRDFSLEEIANAVGVTPQHLQAGFKTETGVSIDDYRNERRVGIVQGWLKSDWQTLSTAELAKRVGFKDAATLDTAFRRHLGISVANYRDGRLG